MAKKNILLILRVWASSALEIYCGGIPNMAETIDTPRMSLEGMWGKMRTQLHSLLLKGQKSKRGEVDSRWTWTLIWQPEKILFHIGARHTDYTEVIQSPKSMRDSLRFFSSPCDKLCAEWRVIGETPWNCYGPPWKCLPSAIVTKINCATCHRAYLFRIQFHFPIYANICA